VSSNPTDRVEIITSVRRRRRWTASEKKRLPVPIISRHREDVTGPKGLLFHCVCVYPVGESPRSHVVGACVVLCLLADNPDPDKRFGVCEDSKDRDAWIATLRSVDRHIRLLNRGKAL
jgi:hypothetical protein